MKPEIDHDRRGSDPITGGRDDCFHSTRPLESLRLLVDGDGITQIDTGGAETFSGALGEDPIELGTRTDRLLLGGAGGDDHPRALHAHHPRRGLGDDGGTGIEANGLLSSMRIKGNDGAISVTRRGQAAFSLADNDYVGERGAKFGLERSRLVGQSGGVGLPCYLKRGPSRDLAATHIGDAIDLDDTVGTVASETDTTTATRMDPLSQERHRH